MDPTARAKLSRKVFVAILALHGVYCALFIFRTSFVIGGVRHFCLFDDAMISMRYARNLAGGFGLVWNPGGDRIEGFSNPLWTLWMAALHLLPVAESTMSLVLQASCYALLLANLFAVRSLAAELLGEDSLASIGAVFLTAVFYPLNYWTLEGMEVGLLALAITVSCHRAIRSQRLGRLPISALAVLGAATLVRLDASVAYAAVALYCVLAADGRRARLAALATAILGGFLLLQFAARLAYYGEWLPNTYYTKMTGFPAGERIARGALAAGEMLTRMNIMLMLLPLSLLLVWPDRRFLLLAGTVTGQVAYSIYVGGDSWEIYGLCNRFIVVAMPLFLVLFTCAVAGLSRWEQAHWRKRTGNSRAALIAGVACLVIVVAAVQFNYLRSIKSYREVLLLTPPLHTQDNRRCVEQALAIRHTTTPDATVAVVRAGAIPYFSRRICHDMLGKCDRRVARMPMHFFSTLPLMLRFYPGHLKWDFVYSVQELQPDVVAESWPPWDTVDPSLNIMTHLAGYRGYVVSGMPMFFRAQSRLVLWERLGLYAPFSIRAQAAAASRGIPWAGGYRSRQSA